MATKTKRKYNKSNSVINEDKILENLNAKGSKRNRILIDKEYPFQETEILPKRCEKSGCTAVVPICFARASEKCALNGSTSRWYHVSLGEHFCNECFEHFYRSSKPGFPTYIAWREKWGSNAMTDPSLRAFMADQMLPYWVQCTSTDCTKWRQISRDYPLTPDFVRAYKCGAHITSNNKKFIDHCAIPEDKRVAEVREQNWWNTLNSISLLKDCPSAPFLLPYYPDGIGLSPTSENANPDLREPESFKNPYFKPFYQPNEPARALCIRPDIMEYDETMEFPQYIKTPTFYLAMRNLVLVLWYQNVKEWLTDQTCVPYIICRGLIRSLYVREIAKVVEFVSRKGLINFGVLTDPPNGTLLPSSTYKGKIIVIGAGAAGLAAAKQLHNFGNNVILLEAKDRIGGRILDEILPGSGDDKIEEEGKADVGEPVVAKGAMIVTGLVNNPFAVIADQMSPLDRDQDPLLTTFFTKMADKCDLIDDVTGHVLPPEVDRSVEDHFNAVLDAVSSWRKDKNPSQDVSLIENITEFHRELLMEEGKRESDLEKSIFRFHLSNLEYACGSDLSKVSSLQWDQNESFTQFDGDHILIRDGYSSIIRKLALNLDIRLNTPVKKIDFSQNIVTIETQSGVVYEADKVLVAVPLAILQDGSIEFSPPLPSPKIKALAELGSGVIEKVAMRFPEKFWADKIEGPSFFGHVSDAPSPSADSTLESVSSKPAHTNDSLRGLNYVFYDMSTTIPSKSPINIDGTDESLGDTTPLENTTSPQKSHSHVLISFIIGEAVDVVNDRSSLTDDSIIELCLAKLRKMFPEKVIPQPISYFITHWQNEPYIKMAYSYIKVGGTGQAYDVLADDIDSKVYFAGDCTNRHFPLTVTGAYLSGILQASRLISPD